MISIPIHHAMVLCTVVIFNVPIAAIAPMSFTTPSRAAATPIMALFVASNIMSAAALVAPPMEVMISPVTVISAIMPMPQIVTIAKDKIAVEIK